MSYLGRVAQRAAGMRGASGLTPAGASASPLARYDQRFNLPGAGALPGVGRARRDGDGRPGDESGEAGFDVGFDARSGPAPTGPTEPGSQSEIARAAPPGKRSPPGAPAAVPPEAGEERRARSGRRGAPATADAQPARGAAEPDGSPSAVARAAWPPEAAPARRTPGAGARERDGAPPAPPASGSALRDPLAEALAKVQRWIAKPPREPVPGGRDGRDGRDGRPGRDRSAGTAADARDGDGRGAGTRGVRARMAAIERATSASPAPPRLRIGRIDVQVVTPAPPAPAPAPVARPGRGASPAPAAPEAAPASYLTFGLRQA
ncbi:MAG TPA: hypothetical protein VIF57_25665 [Polyangia bacterium]